MKWDAQRYDGSFSYVSGYGASLLDTLAPAPGERVLDLGCGTGELAAAITGRGARADGVDGSADMIAKARAGFPELTFTVADGHDFSTDRPYDAVFSNAALHWMSRDPDAVIARTRAALRPGGRFVAEFGGARNCAALIAATTEAVRERGLEPGPSPWYFPTPGEHVNRLEAGGFTVRHLDYFDRPTPLDQCPDGAADWVAMFGSWLLDQVPAGERAAVLARVNELAEPVLRPDGHWFADYVRLRFVAVRTG